MQKTWKMTETLAHWYSHENTQQELSNEYQHDRVWMDSKNLPILVLWAKVASALEGLRLLVLEKLTFPSEVTNQSGVVPAMADRWLQAYGPPISSGFTWVNLT